MNIYTFSWPQLLQPGPQHFGNLQSDVFFRDVGQHSEATQREFSGAIFLKKESQEVHAIVENLLVLGRPWGERWQHRHELLHSFGFVLLATTGRLHDFLQSTQPQVCGVGRNFEIPRLQPVLQLENYKFEVSNSVFPACMCNEGNTEYVFLPLFRQICQEALPKYSSWMKILTDLIG